MKIRANPRTAGPLLMLLAALMFTFLSVLVKLMPGNYTVLHLLFVRCFGGLLVLAGIPWITRINANPFKGHNRPLLIFRGCSGSLAFFAVVTSIRILPISTASVLFYSYPVFAALFGFVIYREKLNQWQIVCIGFLVTGIAVLFDFSLSGSTYGQIMAVVGAVLAGLTVTLIRSLREKNGPAVIYLYFCTMGALFTLPVFLVTPIIPGSLLEWAMVIGIVVTSTSAQLLMNQGFFYCRGWEGAVYMSSETVFTAGIGILCLNDPVSWRFFTGALLIVGSGLFLSKLKSD
ncbi:DMT family transporter [Desulfospira joergensenii]|uniref:DMT family transporter n=1 Tax=Desulfospira joergensenii TaxID=53329 RepID=UPI0003B31857|nr:DMT family transporter [Desulfospira joergensenii]